MLSEEIHNYIEGLKTAYPSITEIWIIGSRANGNANNDSDWDFLVFSSELIEQKIRQNTKSHREDVDLLLVNKEGSFSKPFGKPKGGSLSKLKWRQVSEKLAHYEGCKWLPDPEAEAEGITDLGYLECQTLNAYLL
jgi:hypothetical protein